MPKITLPTDIEILHELGSGRRSHVYMARYLDSDVVVKVYKPEYIEKYQSQYQLTADWFWPGIPLYDLLLWR